jgi:hypothetical protein
MLKTLASLIAASAVYGFTVGSAHCLLYASRNLIKFPLLILSTAIVCSLAYFVMARFLTPELSFRHVQGLVITLFRDLSILLVSLSPVNYFIAQILVHTDDSRLGEYSFFLGMNVVFVAICGTLALVRQARSMLAAFPVSQRRVAAIISSWLLLTLLVGGQAAFYLRPFFGLPVSRGVTPPFALGAEPDVRGATNFYEAMIQIFTEPPLPRSWGE